MANSHLDKIRSGALARAGALCDAQVEQAANLVAEYEADGVETVRLLFADQHGILRGKTVVTAALASAFASGIGMPSTLLLKDTAHKTVFPVWSDDVSVGDMALQGASDILAVPDPATACPVPWSPHSRIILCRVLDRELTPVTFSSTQVLGTAISGLQALGFSAVMGLETEFQVFERVDDGLDHRQATMPPSAVTTRNINAGWQFLTETRYGAAEALLDDIRRTAQQMGLAPRTVEIEMGPSQFEFTFDPSDPMAQAHRYVLFRTMVKEVCHRRGLHASFMAKPKLPNAAANGWHIHQSLLSNDSGENVFMPDETGALTPEAAAWIAGLLDNAPASCLMTTPTVNGYKRYAPFQLAPNRVAWGRDNRGAMVRALLTPGDRASRVENRVADSTVNPYFALASQIISGSDGLRRGAQPPAPTASPYAEDAARLPQSLIAAVEAMEGSALYKETLGESFVTYLTHIKKAEWERYLMTVSEWEQDEYFNLY
ncbi:glutamine synthetase family protein [Phaeobacter sp. QD34_3]|uniref:glutamine synthetase family protein n=1 Tax=unclassified Phaeobacter TaxID=2621772 RepID=UPI00237F3C56|nr:MULTISPECIES: glutamine synthetase family protein [unclassified Phaeobacter]MDE4134908.1 glutamine synthetase family protein [Phaeobacter sp. QD34_3]MDE4138538.1 glutamine synthetase family protein [Phaeobacter sp. QD34_24]